MLRLHLIDMYGIPVNVIEFYGEGFADSAPGEEEEFYDVKEVGA